MRYLAFLGLIASVAACTANSDAATREPDSVARRDSIAGVAAGSMDESQVIGLLDASAANDSAIGSLGAQRAGTREIKDFGIMITREHHALRREAQQMANNLRLAVTPAAIVDVAPRDARAAVDSAPAG